MARGKHAAAAAKRRAESAEEQLDRLLPQLVDAKRVARQYRSEADAAPTLRRQLTELRDQVGMPIADHDRIVAELTAQHHADLARLDDATRVVINCCAYLIERVKRTSVDLRLVSFVNSALLEAIYVLPNGTCTRLFKVMGVDRAEQRNYERTAGLGAELRTEMLQDYFDAMKTTPDLSANDLEQIRLQARRMHRATLSASAEAIRSSDDEQSA